MRSDWVVWLGCCLLFLCGAIWGGIPIASNFFVVDSLHDFSEILGAIATIAAVCVAAVGISAWRSQLRGTLDHELARRLLVNLHRHREAVKNIRYPVVLASETKAENNESRSTDPDMEAYQGLCKAYSQRFSAASEVRILILSELIEADVVWGEEVRSLVVSLFKLEFELSSYIQLHLKTISPGRNVMREAHEKMLKMRRDIMYDDLSAEGDEFSIELNQKLELCERYLKTKFIR